MRAVLIALVALCSTGCYRHVTVPNPLNPNQAYRVQDLKDPFVQSTDHNTTAGVRKHPPGSICIGAVIMEIPELSEPSYRFGERTILEMYLRRETASWAAQQPNILELSERCDMHEAWYVIYQLSIDNSGSWGVAEVQMTAPIPITQDYITDRKKRSPFFRSIAITLNLLRKALQNEALL